MHVGFRFTEFVPQASKEGSKFDQLMKVFTELLNITGGDVSEALEWLTSLDKQYNLTDDSYGVGDFIQDLKDKGYLQENPADGTLDMTAKSEQHIRKSALEEVFGKLKKSKPGGHRTNKTGMGGDLTSDLRPYNFGDAPEQIAMTESLRNAYANHGIDNLTMTDNDLVVREKELRAQTSTVLMIDIFHSMILYGEDRITPAKKVAMALAEMITRKYRKDTLDVIVFGNDAWQIEIKDLPYLQVGPYHTNTVAGVELAMDLLRRRKNPNKQIFMITDGKPTCLKEGGDYYN